MRKAILTAVWGVAMLGVAVWVAVGTPLAAAQALPEPDFICPPSVQLANPLRCPTLGVGAVTAQTSLPLQTPVERPFLYPIPFNKKALVHQYARAKPDTPTYHNPSDAKRGFAPARLLGVGKGFGFIYVSVDEKVTVDAEDWYRINQSEYVRAADLTLVDPSTFSGLRIRGPVKRPFGWVVSNRVYPSNIPGGSPNLNLPYLERYTVVQAYDVVRVGYWDWYLIAPNQWVEQRDLSLAEPQNKPPGGIKGKWVEINLYEQVLVAYQDSQPVFATLISSGLQQFATEPGLFSIYVKVPNTRMSGAYTATQSDYYDIEDVPWTMYFDGDRGIHGAYWHDYFGYRRSHGCINLSLTDAKWLYEWAARGVKVWVHDPYAE